MWSIVFSLLLLYSLFLQRCHTIKVANLMNDNRRLTTIYLQNVIEDRIFNTPWKRIEVSMEWKLWILSAFWLGLVINVTFPSPDINFENLVTSPIAEVWLYITKFSVEAVVNSSGANYRIKWVCIMSPHRATHSNQINKYHLHMVPYYQHICSLSVG